VPQHEDRTGKDCELWRDEECSCGPWRAPVRPRSHITRCPQQFTHAPTHPSSHPHAHMSSPTPAPPLQWLTQVHSLDCFCHNTHTHNHSLYLQRDDVSIHTIYLIQGDVFATAKKIALCPDADAERHDPTNVAVGASVRV
jgi:hypothetical protein